MVDKITDPSKQVNEPVLLKELARQGVDKDYVEFFQDYAPRKLGKEHSPYAEFYRDLKSSKRFMVVSGLPMVDADGNKIEVGWRVAGINYFTEKNNLFQAKVQETQVDITIRNDQPDGRKAGDKLTFTPQLFLNGVEQACSKPVLLPVDPLNPNYAENTLEWDYGICKRRLRIIEGSILGSWVFPAKPSGDITIKYNQAGDFKLRLSRFASDADTEVIHPMDFDILVDLQGGYPVTIGDSITLYPDTSPGGMNGTAEGTEDTVTWEQNHDNAGVYVDANNANANCANWIRFGCDTSGNCTRFFRSYTIFPLGDLPAGYSLSAATVSVYGYTKSAGYPRSTAANVFSGIPASPTTIAATDFAKSHFGATWCDSPIAYASWNAAGYNNFALNATAIAAIQGQAYAEIGWRESYYDAPDVVPPAGVQTDLTLSTYGYAKGSGYKPKLVVTYELGAKKESKTAMADKMIAAGAI